ncbi:MULTISPECIES: alpha-N-arabinofuranosidase [Caproicibacterium]|uniref:non-reducing end alpha-L-arabinofuranosidase n=1 Tax=Caproicibacterium argilliputei TaxID=3030016 RepID=A0AA97H392_9FIRM|nr:alpha-N-arabinofuranosidase [Caproicibacterium argilliputei]WOC32028.1 alpha-N-arabinofuranosidase [Caproicibacterium argilliputei]
MSKITIDAARKKSKINRNIYGHFSEHLGRCIYNGVFVGENAKIPNENGMRKDVVEALRNIQVPVLRWPGGCFADEYHWKDGIGPKETRKRMVNTNWGGVTEDNSFGTHEFMELCRQLGCQPYVNGNVGSGTVQEMSEWVEYMNFDGLSPMTELRKANGSEKPWGVKYFGVGNENWGCGGNMRPEYYADLFRRYQTFARNYGENKLCRIACGPNGADYNWTDKVMASAGPFMDALTLHYYTVPGTWEKKGHATGFDEAQYYDTLKKALFMEELISNHTQVMNKYDPKHRVGLIVDEWGTWYDVEPGTNPGFLYQQNTMRDAMVAALTLNIFNQHSDRVVMANIAQMVNVLQAVILTEGDKMLLTPTYHVFDLYKAHQDAELVDSFVESAQIGTEGEEFPQLSVSASVDEKGVLHLTAANTSLTGSEPVECRLLNKEAGKVSARILAGAMDAHNTFDAPNAVQPEPFDKVTVKGETLTFTMPACSIVEITVE